MHLPSRITRPPNEKTLKENIIDLEGAVASIVAKKVSKKIPEVDIKSNVSKDGWGISLKDTSIPYINEKTRTTNNITTISL
jgi:hypothetical protein